jgi:ABC-type nitrate/sulfonate/bicarbonate transport system substrate-binding protein
MRRTPKYVGLAGLMAISLVFTIACSSSGGNSSQSSQAGSKASLTTINIGGVPSLLYLPAYVAEAEGFFAKEGLEANFLTDITSIPTALIAGSINVGLTGADTAFVTAAEGMPTPILSVLQQRDGISLVVRNGIKGYDASLPYPKNVLSLPKGFTLGITSHGTGSDPLMAAVFGGAGLKEGTDYTAVVLGNDANIIAALKAGKIDVADLVPPFDAEQTSGGVASYLFRELTTTPTSPIAAPYSAEAKSLLNIYGPVAIATPAWVSAHASTAKAFVSAITQAQVWMHDPANLQKLVPIAEKYAGTTDAAAVRSELPDIINLASPQVDCGRLEAEGAVDKAVGVITTVPSCDDLRFANYVSTTSIPSSGSTS